MTLTDAEGMDKIIRVLYDSNRRKIWHHVYLEAGIPKDQAAVHLKNIQADGFIKDFAKGNSLTEEIYVELTYSGLGFFYKGGYVRKFKKDKPLYFLKKDDLEKWVAIVGGIVAIIVAIIGLWPRTDKVESTRPAEPSGQIIKGK